MPLCAGAKVIQALLSPLQSLSPILLRYLCRHVPQLPGKTGALRLQPQSLLLLPFCHPAPKQKVFILPGKMLPLYHMAEERRRQASLKPWKNDCNASPACSPLCPPVRGLGIPTGTEQEWWQELPSAGSSRSNLSLVHSAKRRRPPRPPGSKRRSLHYTARRGHWLWRGFFTTSSSSTHFSALYRSLLNYKNTLKFLWSSQG